MLCLPLLVVLSIFVDCWVLLESLLGLVSSFGLILMHRQTSSFGV